MPTPRSLIKLSFSANLWWPAERPPPPPPPPPRDEPERDDILTDDDDQTFTFNKLSHARYVRVAGRLSRTRWYGKTLEFQLNNQNTNQFI